MNVVLLETLQPVQLKSLSMNIFNFNIDLIHIFIKY